MKVGFPGGLFRAPNTADDVGVSPIYGVMVKMLGMKSAKVTFKVDDQTVFSEDLTQEIVRLISGAEVEFNSNELSLADRVALHNHTVTGGLVQIGRDDTPAWTGLAFKMTRVQNGVTYTQYIRLLKGYLQIPDEEVQGKEDKLSLKDYNLKFVFVPRKYDNLVVEMTDTAFPTYNPADGAAWFTTFGISDTTPPTLASTTPANNATGIVISSAQSWVFSEAIQPGCVNDSNFFLVKDSDGSAVAGTLALSGDKLTVTFTPGASLTAATAYRMICTRGVKDLAGNALAANQVRKFTTA